ncbi:MAG: PorV/PorQ family protein [Bacteroides sp.]|nr:PorV/PorQ family protein [Bacteroides sp.]
MKRTLFTLLLATTVTALSAQEEDGFGPIKTGAANFLTITPDARSAAMGGAGIALPGSNNAIYHNAATAISDNTPKAGATYTFTPWMRNHESGHSLHTLGGLYKIDRKNAIVGGFRYYNYPNVDIVGEKSIHPKELAIEAGYARQLFTGLSLSATLRYIYSDMGNLAGASAASAVAFDLGGFYQQNISGVQGANWSVGFQLSNFGSKIKYLDTKEDLPFVGKIGGSIDFPFNPMHRVILVTDIGYRFAPSDVSVCQIGAGAEYRVFHHFALRGGYHYGDKEKGDARYATAGAGINCHGINLDFAWLFAESDSPHKNIFRLSVGYTLFKGKKCYHSGK